MAGAAGNRHNRNGAPIPPEIDPTGIFEAFMQRMEHLGNNNNRANTQAIAPPRQTGDKLLERFRALRPNRFDGTGEPWRAEQWLRELEVILDAIECNEQDKRRLAVFQLTHAALDWWEAEKATIGPDAIRRMPWVAFKARFLEKYFSEEERDQEEKNFLSLIQGNRTVREYTTQFERLSRFAQHMIDTPQRKIKRFHQGLSSHLRHMMVGHLNQSFEETVRFATSLENDSSQAQGQRMNRPPPPRNFQQRNFPQRNMQQERPQGNYQGNKRTWDGVRKPQNIYPRAQQGQQRGPPPQASAVTAERNNDGCFNCGEHGHIARNCRAPKNHRRMDVICNTCGRRGHVSKDCRTLQGGQYGQPMQGQQGQPGQARLNAIIPDEAGFNVEAQQNLEGTIMLFHSQVKALFDTGASNSFIAVRIMRELGLVPQALGTALNAVSPLGVSVKLGQICRECPLTLGDRNLPADLIVLSMSEFDIILGIDWLTKYYANLDCVSKSITFSIPGTSLFKFQCDPSSDAFLISRLVAIESTNSEITVAQIPIAQEFEDVFEDISGLPPKREIDFCI